MVRSIMRLACTGQTDLSVEVRPGDEIPERECQTVAGIGAETEETQSGAAGPLAEVVGDQTGAQRHTHRLPAT